MAGSRSALIVATYRYDDSRLQALQAPQRDADALAEVLGDSAIGGFEVKTVVNESSHDISVALAEFFAQRRADDVLLVHFSCHGVKDDSGELFLAASDTRMDLLDATAVPSAYVNKVMSRSRSGCVVLLLDCCYAGAFARGMSRSAGDVDVTDRFGGRGRAVITASTALQYAFEGDSPAAPQELGEPSVFTRALVEGLRTGDADRDSDGIVSLDELYAFVHDEVTRVNPDQTPQKWLFDVAGDLYVARRATPVTVPSKLPPELEGTMHSLLSWERLSVVEPLHSLLTGTHPGRALAARLALEDLARHDDSTRVREAAAAALAVAPVAERVVPVPPTRPEERTTEEQITEEQITEEQIAEEQIAEEQVTEEQITEEQITEEQITEERVTEGPIGEETSGHGSSTTAGGTPRWRRWVLLAAAAVVAVVLVVAFLATRGGGGGRWPVALTDSTILLTEGHQLVSYDVDTQQTTIQPFSNMKGVTISEDRQWVAYLDWPRDDGLRLPSRPYVVSKKSGDPSAVPGVGGQDCPAASGLAWSPQGRQLAMTCKSPDGKTTVGLAVYNRDANSLKIVPGTADVCCGSTWVREDAMVVSRTTAPQSSDTELVEISVPSGAVMRTIDTGVGSPRSPDWSRGGLAYADAASPGATQKIFVLPKDLATDQATDAKRWTSPTKDADFPAWDPNGSALAYLVSDSTGGQELYTSIAPGQGVHATNAPAGELGAPAWGSR